MENTHIWRKNWCNTKIYSRISQEVRQVHKKRAKNGEPLHVIAAANAILRQNAC